MLYIKGNDQPERHTMSDIIEYHVTITAPYKKRAKAIAAQKRYGGRFDGSTKTWVYDEKPHAAATQWGTVEEVVVSDGADYDYDYEARR